MSRFEDLKDSATSDAIFGVITHKGLFFRVRYKHKEIPYYIEIPVTDENNHYKEDDEIELQLFIMEEREGVPYVEDGPA